MQVEYNYTENEWNRSIGWGDVPANRFYSGMKRNEGAADSGSIPDISTKSILSLPDEEGSNRTKQNASYGDALASTGQDSGTDHWKGDEPNSRKTSKRKR